MAMATTTTTTTTPTAVLSSCSCSHFLRRQCGGAASRFAAGIRTKPATANCSAGFGDSRGARLVLVSRKVPLDACRLFGPLPGTYSEVAVAEKISRDVGEQRRKQVGCAMGMEMAFRTQSRFRFRSCMGERNGMGCGRSAFWGEGRFVDRCRLVGQCKGGGGGGNGDGSCDRPCMRPGGAMLTEARVFGPAIFEAQKLRVMFLGVREDQHPAETRHPRTYTLTHSDITSKLTLAVATDFNASQFEGWYSKLQRDEVLAVWRHHCRSFLGGDATQDSNAQGLLDYVDDCGVANDRDNVQYDDDAAYIHPQIYYSEPCSVSEDQSPSCCHMSLHVHCHISGGHFWLNMIAALRYWIFRKELPVVLEAFRHGDRALFDSHPDLEDAVVWVHFHSNIPQYNQHETWGPLHNSAQVGTKLSKGHLIDAAQHLFHPAAAFTAAAAAREHRWPWSPIAGMPTEGIGQQQQKNHQQQHEQHQQYV